MAKYRLAVLSNVVNNNCRLSVYSVSHYLTIQAASDQAARTQAERLNAVVCGWRVQP